MVRLFIGAIIWLAFIPVEVKRNYKLIEIEKEKPNYLLSFAIRAFVGIVCVFIIYEGFDPAMDVLIIFELWDLSVIWQIREQLTIWQARHAFIFEATTFYLVFDPLLNRKRGLEVDYQGKNSGWLDRLRKWAYVTLKVMCFVALIYSSIILF